MSKSTNKILGNLIKADLQDFLNNEKRLEKGWYFFPYDDMSGRIWVIKDRGKGVIISPEIENLVRENALANARRRQEKHEKLWAEETKRYKKRGITLPNKKFKLDKKEIWQEELEKEDYDEIVNLIKQVNQARDVNEKSQRRERNEKLAQNPQLFYWGGNGYINPLYINEWKNEKYRYFEKKITEKELWTLKIDSLHPALNNFPFEKEGFYIIEGTDNLPWESRPFNSVRDNFNKFVELGDKITITPYEVENDSELSKKEKAELGLLKDCDICQKNENEMDNGTEKWYTLRHYRGQISKIIQACSTCYKNKEQEYLQNYEFIFSFPKKDLTHEGIPFLIENIKGRTTDCYAGKKDQNGKILQQQNCSHCQPWKSHKPSNLNESELDINTLIQYFQKHSIKKISFKNGELVITHNNNNNNKTISSQEENNSQELQLARNIIQKSNLQELTSEELNKMVNNNSNQQSNKPNNNNALWIGCGIGGTLVIGIIIGWLMRKKTKNK